MSLPGIGVWRDSPPPEKPTYTGLTFRVDEEGEPEYTVWIEGKFIAYAYPRTRALEILAEEKQFFYHDGAKS